MKNLNQENTVDSKILSIEELEEIKSENSSSKKKKKL